MCLNPSYSSNNLSSMSKYKPAKPGVRQVLYLNIKRFNLYDLDTSNYMTIHRAISLALVSLRVKYVSKYIESNLKSVRLLTYILH